MHEHLSPTLWRSCRALANKHRLSLLQALIDSEPLTVSELAERCQMHACTCSLRLRQINARGLLQVARQGKWVRYSLGADPDVPHAGRLLTALSKALRHCRSNTYDAVINDLTLFTHPRRIQLVCALQQYKITSHFALMRLCGISQPALYRHLSKLERRGAVKQTAEGVTLRRPKRLLAQTLLALATSAPVHP